MPTIRPLRERVVEAAADLLRSQGVAAVTTRRVAEAAGVQAPAIYRLFGDKDGLLDAVAEHVMSVQAKAKAEALRVAGEDDPMAELRAAWTEQIEFGLANPGVFRLLSDPARAAASPAAAAGRAVLEARVHRVAAAGRLRLPEALAVGMVQAAGIGTIQTLLATHPEARDPELPAAVFDAVQNALLVDAPPPAADPVRAAAVAFGAVVPRLETLSPSERSLLADWVDRVVTAPARGTVGVRAEVVGAD